MKKDTFVDTPPGEDATPASKERGWSRLSIAVVAALVLEIIFFSLFTKYFS